MRNVKLICNRGVKFSHKIMHCPKCKSPNNKKNGFHRGKQS